MSDDLYRAVGEANGKLDALATLMRDYIESHNRRHENIDAAIVSHAADINQAKGAKRATLALAGAAATVISLAVAAAGKFL